VSPELGEDTVICGGGRYDRLVSDLGGPQVPGIGFAIGEDRLVEILPEIFRSRVLGRPLVAVLPIGSKAAAPGLALARELVAGGITTHTEVTGRSLKAGMKWAGKIGARAVVILGEDEIANNTAVIRDLERSEQEPVSMDQVVEHVARVMISDGK
jgi:histidyl-tRNA synthetase